MPKLMQLLFIDENESEEISKLDEEIKQAISDIKKLEDDWKEKVKQVKEFLENWDKKWDLARLKSNIRIIKKIILKGGQESKEEEKAVLFLRHFIETEAKKRKFPISDYVRLQNRFQQNQAIWDELEENLKSQLKWIDENAENDIGMVRFKIKEFTTLLKEEAKLLGLEEQSLNLLIEVERLIENKLRAGFHISGLGVGVGEIGSKRFTLSYNGINFSGLLEITESADSESMKLAEMTIELKDPNGIVVAKFRSIFRYDDASIFQHGISNDRKRHKYWISQHREIDKRYRRIGLGECLMNLWEQISD